MASETHKVDAWIVREDGTRVPIPGGATYTEKSGDSPRARAELPRARARVPSHWQAVTCAKCSSPCKILRDGEGRAYLTERGAVLVEPCSRCARQPVQKPRARLEREVGKAVVEVGVRALGWLLDGDASPEKLTDD